MAVLNQINQPILPFFENGGISRRSLVKVSTTFHHRLIQEARRGLKQELRRITLASLEWALFQDGSQKELVVLGRDPLSLDLWIKEIQGKTVEVMLGLPVHGKEGQLMSLCENLVRCLDLKTVKPGPGVLYAPLILPWDPVLVKVRENGFSPKIYVTPEEAVFAKKNGHSTSVRP